MVSKRLKDYENGKISSWEFVDIDTKEIVYYVKRILLDDGRVVIRFGKTGGEDFVKIYHSPRLAFNAFMEIADTLTSQLIQRDELDLRDRRSEGARMNTPLNYRTVTLKLKRIEVCDLLLACHNISQVIYAGGENGENKWDRLEDKLDQILTEFDKKQDVMM